MGTVLGGKVALQAAAGGSWPGPHPGYGPGWRQSKRPARMRCSDAGRPSPGTT